MLPVDLRPLFDALGIGDAASVSPVDGGTDTALWRVERAGERYALRLFRPGQEAVCERELLKMAAAERAGSPARLRADASLDRDLEGAPRPTGLNGFERPSRASVRSEG